MQASQKSRVSTTLAIRSRRDRCRTSIRKIRNRKSLTDAQYQGALGELTAAQQALARTPQYVKTAVGVQLNPAILDLDQKIKNIDKRIDAIKKLRASQAGPSAVARAHGAAPPLVR